MEASNSQREQTPPIADEKDPYCPASKTGRASDCSEETSLYDEASLSRTIEVAKNAFALKKQELEAVGEVVAAETELFKKSAIITVASLAAAFIFTCFSWIALNVLLALGLVDLGLHYLVAVAIVLGLNIGVVVFALVIANHTYKRVSLRPIFEALLGKAGN
ncbi:hypothetical protein OPS25_07080 [Alteromonas ponticola]|uniref:Phage holin family protein n=1 Tax=Alteromonas aquimaris TaxID=2998417 RepID=A0ABT3P664_9ALTE|nr:hypothetical protein [Alteromonas aquimaris]MCW8108254.1 hypothetical protein [Alteromonas aquimaris]